jgi:hypothetical protein
MFNAVQYNPLGMTDKSVADLYWAGVQLRNSRRDNLNLATFN